MNETTTAANPLRSALEKALEYLEAQLDGSDSLAYIVPRLIEGYVALAKEDGITPLEVHQRRLNGPWLMPSVHGEEGVSEWEWARVIAPNVKAISSACRLELDGSGDGILVLPQWYGKPVGVFDVNGDDVQVEATIKVIKLALEWEGITVL